MTPEERKVFENIRSPHLKYWIPVVWFSNLASRARQEGRIRDAIDLQNILNVKQEVSPKHKHDFHTSQEQELANRGATQNFRKESLKVSEEILPFSFKPKS